MPYRTLAVLCLFGLLCPRPLSSQDYPNQATLQIGQLLLTAMIDKFAYAPGERITAVFKVVNPMGYPITIDAPRTCSLIGRLEWWCSESRSNCFGHYDRLLEERCTEQVEFPHGETVLQTKVFKAIEMVRSVDIPTSGQIEFNDPWGGPRSYRIILEYHNPATVAVNATAWGFVKQLYR
jgi:hypothetical protein